MSGTSTLCVASAVNNSPVTPGRSCPVTVTRTVDSAHPPNGADEEPEPSPSGIFRCELDSASSRAFQPRCGWASVRIRSTMYGWCSSNAGRSDRIRGSEVKLCRGGGELVAHSSELPYPHGSSAVVTSPCRYDRMMFQMNGRVDAPSTNAPIEDQVFSVVNPS